MPIKKLFLRSVSHIFFVLALPAFSPIQAQSPRIFVDGFFDDWENIAPIYDDARGDNSDNAVDFGRLWMTNDDRFLYLRLEVGGEINLQNDNQIVLYIDSDNDASTGKTVLGIGAELEWRFGQRSGTFYGPGQSFQIRYHAIGLVTLPTVTSTEFEIAIDRESRPGNNILFSSDSIRIAFSDLQSGGDMLPDSGEQITYHFNSMELPPLPPVSLEKQDDRHVRVMTYNVLRDRFFEPSVRENYQRIFQALQPEILGFEEIYDHSAGQAKDIVEALLPPSGGQQWYAAKQGTDVIAVSRFPILKSQAIEGNGAFLLDLRARYYTDLLLIVAHPPCCANNEGRQQEIDAIMAFIRDAENGSQEFTIEAQTPILIMGDMNLVGYAQQLQTFLKGEIVNKNIYGQSFDPDWDGTALADLAPYIAGYNMAFTWYDENSSFSPGRLDYMIYTDSVLKTGNHFILFTPVLSEKMLQKYALQKDDVLLASDHLPVVGDFIFPRVDDVARKHREKNAVHSTLLHNYPNPFNLSTRIIYNLQQPAHVRLRIMNIHGDEVKTLINAKQTAGKQATVWDGTDEKGVAVSSGIYFIYLQVDEQIYKSEILFIK